MARTKKMKDPVKHTFDLEKDQLARIQYMARQMSNREGRSITCNEAIRMSLAASYPVPKNQMDLF